MKNYIKYIPRTAFAAAMVLGVSLSAEEAASQGTGMRDQQRQNQQPDRATDEKATERTVKQAGSHPMMASKVLGMNIDTAGNEKIGEIDEIYVDTNTGEVLALVVSTGGFLGIGQQQSLISPEDLRLNAERTVLHTDITKEQIREAPRYEKGETTGFDQVRPMGANASDWEERRAQRTDRTGAGQEVGDRRATGQDRTQDTDRKVGGQSDRQTTGQERTQATDRNEGDRNVADRQVTGEARTQGMDRDLDRQSDRRATGEDRTERTDRNIGQNVGDRQTTGQERTERSDWSEGEQSKGHGLAISELQDMSVENRQGDSVGDVNEIYIDPENWELVGVVLSTGGFLGIGDRKTLFGLQEMSFDPSNESAVLDYNRDQIREFPEFVEDDQSVFENLRERMGRLGSPRGTRSASAQQ